MVGSVFTGIHGNRISTFVQCSLSPSSGSCTCLRSLDPGTVPDVYTLHGGDTCAVVVTSIKDILILQCALNAIASGVCFWFITLLWKSRYHEFYSGLRFYSCTSSPEQGEAQWEENSSAKYPPYQQTALPPSPIFDSVCVTNGNKSNTTKVVVEHANGGGS